MTDMPVFGAGIWHFATYKDRYATDGYGDCGRNRLDPGHREVLVLHLNRSARRELDDMHKNMI